MKGKIHTLDDSKIGTFKNESGLIHEQRTVMRDVYERR